MCVGDPGVDVLRGRVLARPDLSKGTASRGEDQVEVNHGIVAFSDCGW